MLVLTQRDTVVLADFVNTTGDAVFGGTLKRALAVSLQQSPEPFLSLPFDKLGSDVLVTLIQEGDL